MQRRRMLSLCIFLICSTTAAWSADVSILRAEIAKLLPRARGGVGVAIKHFESGTEIVVNGDQEYPMASAYKLPILVELVYQRAAGKLCRSCSMRLGFSSASVT